MSSTLLTNMLFAQAAAPTTTATTELSFVELMFHGSLFANIVMVTVLLLGVLSLYLFLERWFFIKRMNKTKDPNVMRNLEDYLRDGRIDSAIDYCQSLNSPEGRVLEKGVSRIGRPVSDIVSAMENQGQVEVGRLEKNLNLLAAVPSLAPMLGLLGTVIGMILAFFSLSTMEGSFTPNTLSKGIYTALGQTAVGLAVAIPANFFYNLLLTRIDKFILKMQNLSSDFLDIINKPL